MDELVTEESAYSSLYKYSGKTVKASLQDRITNFLTAHKEQRHNAADRSRNFSEVFFGKESAVNDELSMECEELSIEHKKRKKLAFKLMKSEWFTELPEDLTENWFVKFCPDGFRVLIVAENNTTVCYARSGKTLFHMKSGLPGGGKESVKGLTVLDCVYHKVSKTIFVSDCLCWNSLSMLDSEAAFRFYWLKSKFDENPVLTNTNKNFKFSLLECYVPEISFIQDRMSDVLTVGKHNVACDGIVLYHKEGHYISCITPLVGFIPSFGLSEILNIDVSPKHLLKTPPNYSNLKLYIEEIVKKTKYKSDDSMDVQTVE